MLESIWRLLKKWIIISFFCLILNFTLQGSFVGQQVVFAQTNANKLEDKVTEITSLSTAVIRLSNMLLRPILMVCGRAMDNAMITGERFSFDLALWNLWNITKNIANFLLAFLFFYTIFKELFSGKDVRAEAIKSIKKVFIAGILVQASRFLSLAGIDISTIATYWIWGLPIHVVKNTATASGDLVVFKREMIINADESNSTDLTILHTKSWNISPCETITYTEWNVGDQTKKTAEVIIWRKVITYETKSESWTVWTGTMPWWCHYTSDMYNFNDKWSNSPEAGSTGEAQAIYKNKLLNEVQNLTSKTQIQDCISIWHCVEVMPDVLTLLASSATITGTFISNSGFWLDTNKLEGLWETVWLHMSELLSGQSYIWVMSSLYANLLSEKTVGKWQDNYIQFLNTMLEVLYRLALIVPLLALAVVLVVRIVILWILIAICPIWIVLVVFWLTEKLPDTFKETFKLSEVIKLLLAPVFVTFAVSMSTVFVALINSLNQRGVQFEDAGNDILKLFSIQIKGASVDFGKFITSIIWVAIVWALLFWSIKITKVWEKIWGSMQKITQELLMNKWIIPVGSWHISLSQLDPSNRNWILWKTTDKLKEIQRADMYRSTKWTMLESLYADELKQVQEKDLTRLNQNINNQGVRQTITTALNNPDSKEIKYWNRSVPIDSFVNDYKWDDSSSPDFIRNITDTKRREVLEQKYIDQEVSKIIMMKEESARKEALWNVKLYNNETLDAALKDKIEKKIKEQEVKDKAEKTPIPDTNTTPDTN